MTINHVPGLRLLTQHRTSEGRHPSYNRPYQRAVASPPSDRSELTPKARARLFDARAAMKPQKAPWWAARRAAAGMPTRPGRGSRVQGYRATKAIFEMGN